MNGNTKIQVFHVHFFPNEDIFSRGVNPFAILNEINELGACLVCPYFIEIPSLEHFEVGICFFSWNIFLETTKTESDIEDVFMFVFGQYEIHQISTFSLLGNDVFLQKIKELISFSPLISASDLENCVKDFSNTKSEIELFIDNSENTEKILIQDNSYVYTGQATSSIKVSSEKLDNLMNLVSELITKQAALSLLAEEEKNPNLLIVIEDIEKITRKLKDNALNIRLVPINNLLLSLRQMVHQIAAELNKEVDFAIEGGETELDKNIIDYLATPLMHILRNSIDHGIEQAEVRVQKAKPPKGRLQLFAFHTGTNVFIQIHDDGAGIDVHEIREKAIQKNLIPKDAILTNKEIYNLLFIPHFSAAKRVTETSGNGMGLDIVKQKIFSLRGEVEIDSELHLGTIVTIKLPLTLSIIDTLLISIDHFRFLIPVSAVDSCEEIEHSELIKIHQKRFILNDELVPFLYLRDEFEILENPPDIEKIIVVKYEEKRVALIVDTIIGEHQAVLKPLGEIFKNQDYFSGASILGDGNVAFVIDVNKLIKRKNK